MAWGAVLASVILAQDASQVEADTSTYVSVAAQQQAVVNELPRCAVGFGVMTFVMVVLFHLHHRQCRVA